MYPFVIRSTQLKWQLSIALVGVTLLGLCIWFKECSRIDLTSLDRSTFITALSAFASILALFCSLSIAWILFVSQQNKGERVTAYDLLKARLLETQQWLLTEPLSEDREICLGLVFELDKLDLSDMPQTDLGDEYRAYAKALESGLDGENQLRRQFYLRSIAYFGYIENLISRIGLISIRQIITKMFIDTLAKGVALVSLAVLTLIASCFWYGDSIKPWLVLMASFCGIATVLLLYEVWVDMRRHYDEDLDFIDHSPSHSPVGQAVSGNSGSSSTT